MIVKKYKYFFEILILQSGLQIKYNFIKLKHLHPYNSNERWQGVEQF